MTLNFAKITIEGRVVNDLEIREVGKEKKSKVCDIKIAVNSGVDKDKNEIPAVFYKVTVWGKDAERHAKAIKKGSRVLVNGRPGMPNAWLDKEKKPHAEYTIEDPEIHWLDTKEKEK